MPAIIVKFRYILLLAVIGTMFLPTCGCDKKPSQSAEKSTDVDKAVSDRPLAGFQIKLLDAAFEAASSIPVKPYVKDLCLAQEKVVDRCIELGQPIRAARYADQIRDWRRGLCYAKTAYYLAQNGYSLSQVQKGLEMAQTIAAMDHGQQWRSDRIKAVISQTYSLLGMTEQADEFGKNLEKVESGKMLEKTAVHNKELSFDQMVVKLDAAIAIGNFEITRSALYGYAGLFSRYYGDPEKRKLAEEKIRVHWQKMPFELRIELLKMLTEAALEHADQSKALELVNEVQGFLETNNQWPLDVYIPTYAALIELRFKAEDTQKAIADADVLLKLYDERGTEILDIHRAETLVPLAEAYQVMGKTPSALTVYKKAVEVCTINPVKKYHAEDLSAICCSMALYAVEPDTDLWTRIHEIAKGLSNPW